MATVLRTDAAENDLREIAYYIVVRDRRPVTADKVVDDILRKCKLYAETPEMGTRADDLGSGYRLFAHKRWVIIYRSIVDGIVILRIVDGARDYSSLF